MRSCALVLIGGLVAAAPPVAASPDWGVTRDPFDRGDIARYKALLAKNPHDPALAKLAGMYRSYRTLAVLVGEYTQTDWASLVVRARLLVLAGDPAGALAACLQAARARDNDPRTWMLLGELYGSDRTGARAAYDAALQFAPRALAPKILERLIDLAVRSDDILDADAYYARWLALEPNNATIWLARADMLLDGNRVADAAAAYTKVEPMLAGNPMRRLEAIARRGLAHAKTGRDDEAIADFRRAIAMGPPSRRMEAELTGRIVDAYRRKHALPELVAHYEATWPKATRSAFQWATLAELYDEVGEDDVAIAAFERVVAMTPNEPAAHHRLIDVLDRAGRTADVTARYEDAVRLLPREPDFQLALADRYFATDHDRAIAVLDRLATRLPDAPGVLDAIAARYVRWGRHDLAIAVYERLAVGDPEYLVTIAEQYAVTGQSARLVAVAERVARRRDPALALKLAQVAADYGMWPEARDAYTAAIALDATNPLAHVGRALAHEHFKDWTAAAEDADRALELAGNGRPSRVAALHPLLKPVSRSRARERDPQTWKSAAAAPDPKTDYMLAEYLTVRLCTRDPSYVDCEPAPQNDPVGALLSNSTIHTSLQRLVEVLPRDIQLRRQLTDTFHSMGAYDEEIASLKVLIQMVPAEAPALEKRIQEATLAAYADRGTRWDKILGWTDPDDMAASVTRTHDPRTSDLRIGLRVGVGGGIRGDVGRLVGIGINAVALRAVVARVDWTQRAGDGSNAIAASGGFVYPAATTRNAMLAIGFAMRGELRWSDEMATPHVLSGDATVDLISRRTPLGVGLRLGQEIAGGSASTATFELAVEWR